MRTATATTPTAAPASAPATATATAPVRFFVMLRRRDHSLVVQSAVDFDDAAAIAGDLQSIDAGWHFHAVEIFEIEPERAFLHVDNFCGEWEPIEVLDWEKLEAKIAGASRFVGVRIHQLAHDCFPFGVHDTSADDDPEGIVIRFISDGLVEFRGERIELPPIAFALLQALAADAFRSLSFDDIKAAVWPEAPVEDELLLYHVERLESALGVDRGGLLLLDECDGFLYLRLTSRQIAHGDGNEGAAQ